MSIFSSILTPVAELGRTWVEGKVAKTKARAEAEAKVLTIQAKSSADWETYMARQAGRSLKDEWLTALVSIPLILCWVPPAVPFVREGFEVLATMPEFLQYTVSLVFAASFGVRGAIGIMNKTKGKHSNGS